MCRFVKMDSETKRIKNDLVNPQQNSGQTPQISQQNNIPQQQPIIFYQNLQYQQHNRGYSKILSHNILLISL